MGYVTVAVTGLLGNSFGAAAGWALGAVGGRPLVERHGRYLHVDAAKLDRTERWLDTRGALFVFAGLALGTPMDLNFTRFEAAAIGLAVLATALIALDGETHWLEGAFLVAVYAVLAIGFYFVGS